MISKDDFLLTPIGEALKDLSEKMEEKNISPVKLNVVGGFALILREIRDKNEVTDIDYVGGELSEEFLSLAKRVGEDHGMEKDWINNHLMMTGCNVEDLEFSTGPLAFSHAFNVGRLQINALEEEALLRMKLVSIDTALMAYECGGNYSRAKDLPDISNLMEKEGISVAELKNSYMDYTMHEKTYDLIKSYQSFGDEGIKNTLKTIKQDDIVF